MRLFSRFIPAAAVALFLLSSCGIFKKTSKEQEGTVKDSLAQSRMVRDSIYRNLFEYDWLSARARVTLPGAADKQMDNFTLHLRMRRDSVIWMSVQSSLGFEAIRVLLTRDSCYLLDRLNKQSVIRDIGYVSSLSPLPLTFRDVEAILTGNPVFFPGDSLTMVPAGAQDTGQVAFRSFQACCTGYFSVDTMDYKVRTVSITDRFTGKIFTLIYSRHEDAEGGLFPREVTFGIPLNASPGGHLQAVLEYTKVKIHEPLSFPFKIPEKYE